MCRRLHKPTPQVLVLISQVGLEQYLRRERSSSRNYERGHLQPCPVMVQHILQENHCTPAYHKRHGGHDE